MFTAPLETSEPTAPGAAGSSISLWAGAQRTDQPATEVSTT